MEYFAVCDKGLSPKRRYEPDPNIHRVTPEDVRLRGLLVDLSKIKALLSAKIESECAKGIFLKAILSSEIVFRDFYRELGYPTPPEGVQLGQTHCLTRGKHFVFINLPVGFRQTSFLQQHLQALREYTTLAVIHELWHVGWGCLRDCEYELPLVLKCTELMTGFSQKEHLGEKHLWIGQNWGLILGSIHCECCACFDYALRRGECEGGHLSDY